MTQATKAQEAPLLMNKSYKPQIASRKWDETKNMTSIEKNSFKSISLMKMQENNFFLSRCKICSQNLRWLMKTKKNK